MKKGILLLFFLVNLQIVLFTSLAKAQCPAGGILYHNCGGCIPGCVIGNCTGAQITGNCPSGQQFMTVTIIPPTPTCQLTVTGYFRKYPPNGSGGACNSSGIDGSSTSDDYLQVGLNAKVTGPSNTDGISTYYAPVGQSVTVSGQSNRRDEVITYSIACTGTCDLVQPVELLYLNGEVIPTGIVLHWATASETNNDQFIIEYSNDGIHFYEAAVIKGAGNSNVVHTYSSEIRNRFIGTTYFRLKQRDFDGTTTKYPQLFAHTKSVEDDFFVASHENESEVHLNIYHETSVSMQIYNVVGNTLVEKLQLDLKEGEHIIPLQRLAAGLYVCSVVLDNQIYTQRFIVY